MQRAIEYLNMFSPKKIYTLTMFYKPHSVYKPDYFAKTTSAWIIFPYELTETISSIMTSMKKENKSEKEIEQCLHSLHYTQEEIQFVKKHYMK